MNWECINQIERRLEAYINKGDAITQQDIICAMADSATLDMWHVWITAPVTAALCGPWGRAKP